MSIFSRVSDDVTLRDIALKCSLIFHVTQLHLDSSTLLAPCSCLYILQLKRTHITSVSSRARPCSLYGQQLHMLKLSGLCELTVDLPDLPYENSSIWLQTQQEAYINVHTNRDGITLSCIRYITFNAVYNFRIAIGSERTYCPESNLRVAELYSRAL